MNNLMIDRRNAEKELQGRIAEMLMPMHPEAADLKAGEILKLAFNFYVSGSADDECFYCRKLRNEDGTCECPESWSRHCH